DHPTCSFWYNGLESHLPERVNCMRKLLVRRQQEQEQYVQEPTLLAFVLVIMGLLVGLAICLMAIAFVPAFGYRWWVFAAVAASLTCLVQSFRRKSKLQFYQGRKGWLRRILTSARLLFIIVLTCWLGLILWSVFSVSGPDVPSKDDPALIRVVTWNIHCG